MAHAQQRGPSRATRLLNQRHRGRRVLRVEARRGLVGENEHRVGHDRPCNRDALLLADRQRVHRPIQIRQPQGLERINGPLAMLTRRKRGEHQGGHDVLGRGKSRKQVEGLKDHPEPLAAKEIPGRATARVHRLPAETDLAFGRVEQPRDQLEKGALPRARAAGDQELVTRGHRAMFDIDDPWPGRGVPESESSNLEGRLCLGGGRDWRLHGGGSFRRERTRGEFTGGGVLRRSAIKSQVIDLDHNATTRPSEAVTEAVVRGLREVWHNPSSVHRAGQAARAAVELARRSAANLIGALPREIVFTSGGTEAIHLAIRGTLESHPARAHHRGPPTLLTTRTEHSAVRELAEELVRTGKARVVWAEVDRRGVVDVTAFESACASAGELWLACVQWANNETGVVQPIEALSAAARKHGGLFLCDATQWVGKMPVETLDPFDLLIFAPHKFHGPKGVGVFWSRRGVRFRPSVAGSQELGRRGGTENVPGILGAGVACDEAAAWLGDIAAWRGLAVLRDRLEQAILAGVPGTVVNGGEGGERLWNTTNIGFPRLEAEALLLALSERGVNASAGAACSSGSLDPSPVLLAMGVPPEIAHGSVRFSLSRLSTAEEIDQAATIIIEAANRLYRSMHGLG